MSDKVEDGRDLGYGTVILREFFSHHDGGQYNSIMGNVIVRKDKQALGFEVNTKDSNWYVSIVGSCESVTFTGCAVKGFAEHKPKRAGNNVLVVP